MSNDEIKSNNYHQNAKSAGNRLSAYITNSCIGAIGVFFLALTNNSKSFYVAEKAMLIIALLCFVLATLFRFLELHYDSKRFYTLGIELSKNEDSRSWTDNEKYKSIRLKCVWSSYWTFGVGIIASLIFLILRII